MQIVQWFVIKMLICGIHSFNNFADIACGTQKSRRLGKVVGGNDADKAEFPWIVSITRRGGHFCGGTVINKKYILTAGHCLCSGSGGKDFLKASNIKVTLSQHDLSSMGSDAFEVAIKAIMVHPDYTCNKPKDDIAMLEVEKLLIWSNTLIPACLPSSGEEKEYNSYEDVLATVAGWGWTHEDNSQGSRAKTLQKAKVNVLGNEKCREWYKSQGKKTKIQEQQMCAGHEQGGIDACWADSGGPLMVESDDSEDQTVVIGVVSTGIGCARPKLPGIYTRVSEYISWIQEIVKS